MTGSWVAQDQAIATLSRSLLDHFLPRPIVVVFYVNLEQNMSLSADSLAWPAFK